MPSLEAQRLRCLPTMRETRVQSLGQEDPLGKEMATHSSILAWRIPWTEEPGRLQPMGSQSRTRLRDFTFTFTFFNKGKTVRFVGLGCPGFNISLSDSILISSFLMYLFILGCSGLQCCVQVPSVCRAWASH